MRVNSLNGWLIRALFSVDILTAKIVALHCVNLNRQHYSKSASASKQGIQKWIHAGSVMSAAVNRATRARVDAFPRLLKVYKQTCFRTRRYHFHSPRAAECPSLIYVIFFCTRNSKVSRRKSNEKSPDNKVNKRTLFLELINNNVAK